MNSWLVRHLVFPVHEWLKGHPTMAALREARAWDRMSLDAMAGAQLAKLRDLVTHATTHVPYYRQRFVEVGVSAASLVHLDDLRRFPLLNRSDLRQRVDEFVATDRRRRMACLATGGSTGEPVRVMVDRRRAAVTTAARIRAREWWGIRPGEREAVLWASPIEIGAQDRLRSVRDRFLNTRLYSAFEGSPEGIDAIVRDLRRYRPAALYGYASSLSLLADRVLACGDRAHDLGARVAFATAEAIRMDQRQALADAFGVRVAGEYGARDAGLIAHECPAGGCHVLAESMLVEVIRPDGRPAGPGERGEIVTTHLEARGFPLIRYRTGDVGVMAGGTCDCGRALPRFSSVEGRATDFLLAPDGRLLHALGVIYILRVLPGVASFQVEQDAVDHLVVRLVLEDGFPPDGESTVRHQIQQLLRAEVAVDVQIVTAIPAARSGKFRYVISPVAERALRGDAESALP